MTMKHRVTILQTHPAQYMAPWFRYMTAERRDIDLTVLYASTPMPAQQGVGFSESFAWDVSLTQGYTHKVLAEPHYTPIKVFPALLANRPLLALYHERSTVIPMLQAAAPSPAARTVTFGDSRPVSGTVSCVADAIAAMMSTARTPVRIDHHALEPWSAHALAGRLASVCDQVAA